MATHHQYTDFPHLAGMLTATTPENVPKPAVWIARAHVHSVKVTASWRVIDQLFECCREHDKATPLSKEELAHWVKGVIMQAFLNAGQEVPLKAILHALWLPPGTAKKTDTSGHLWTNKAEFSSLQSMCSVIGLSDCHPRIQTLNSCYA